MKKIIIMLLIALSLCACSDKKEEPPVENNPVPPQTQPVPSSNEPDEKKFQCHADAGPAGLRVHGHRRVCGRQRLHPLGGCGG